MLACVTFVNNKLFVDAINHNSRAIGEHSKVVLDFYLSLLKDAIYGNEKINKYVRDVFGVDSVVYIFVTESMSVADLEIEWK